MQTLSSAIDWWAEVTPDTLALSIGSDRISYRQLRDWSERIAARLVASGVRAGDRVGVCAANSAEYCALAHGIIRAAAIVAPMNARYTPHELSEIVGDSAPRLIFADEERRARLGFADCPIEAIEDLRAVMEGERARVDRQPAPADPVVIIATSGSTAKPKGVVYTNQSMTAYAAAWAIEEPSCAKGARIIVPAPLSTSAGFVQLMHYTTLGCSLFFEAAFDPDAFLDIIVRERINGFAAVPLFFERVAEAAAFASADLSSLRVVTTGGARVSRALQEKWDARGVVLRQIYGQTEAGGNATIMPEALATQFPEKCGRGGVFTELAIINPAGERLAAGETGQIIVRGPGVMRGYWNNAQATSETLRNGWLYTGDLGVLDEQGMLTFVDRMKDIIISGGLNISAAEVERCIAEFPGVEEVMVIAASDRKFGETPMAVVYAKSAIDTGALIAHCNAQLADYKVPRYVVVESEPMPRTATGKLSKPPVRARYQDAAERLVRVR